MSVIRVRGVAKTKQGAKKAVEQIKTGVRRGVTKACRIIATESKQNAPIDTGNLRASHFVYFFGAAVPQPRIINVAGVEVEKLKRSHDQAMFAAQVQIQDNSTVRVGATAFYALLVEFGSPSRNWNDGGPQFLKRAVYDNTSSVLRLAALGGSSAIK